MNNLLQIKRVLGQPDFGGCRPVWIKASDNKEYLLKFRYDGNEVDISNFNEYLGYRLTDALGYKISEQPIHFIMLKEEDIELFENANIDIPAKSYARKSIGINLGIWKIPYVEKAENIDNAIFKKRLANVDNYILNSDRHTENPNVLYNKQNKKYYAIDYGMALLDHRIYEAIKDGKDLNNYAMALENCNITKKNHYLLQSEKKLHFNYNFEEVSNLIKDIITECPVAWEPVQYKEEIADIIATRVVNRQLFSSAACPEELYL